MAVIRIFAVAAAALIAAACLRPAAQQSANAIRPVKTPAKSIKTADSFAYPISVSEYVTQKKDKDEWYNALDFGESDHLGEDWNKNTGGNTDCGEPVFAIANGLITYAGDAGPGWGNVLIIEHQLPSGERIESLYGHMNQILKSEGEVLKREKIALIGGANGRYPCHLHFEIRKADCPMWGQAGGGYSADRRGWADPSDFIDAQRKQK